MTVEGPYTWIIRIELHHNVPIRPHHLCVATLGVCRIDKRLVVVKAFALLKNIHVVAMKMHWLDCTLACVFGHEGGILPLAREERQSKRVTHMRNTGIIVHDEAD